MPDIVQNKIDEIPQQSTDWKKWPNSSVKRKSGRIFAANSLFHPKMSDEGWIIFYRVPGQSRIKQRATDILGHDGSTDRGNQLITTNWARSYLPKLEQIWYENIYRTSLFAQT